MAQTKYNLHGMLITSNEDDKLKRRQRIVTLFNEAMRELEAIKAASAAEVAEAKALQVAAAARHADCEASDRARLQAIDERRLQISKWGREISAIQHQITTTQTEIGLLAGATLHEIEAERNAVDESFRQAKAAAEAVDRKYGKKLRAAENEAERYRVKLVRLDLRGTDAEVTS
jgi:hypothetical protein